MDFEGAIVGMTHLISGKKNNRLFMPATFVSIDQSKLEQPGAYANLPGAPPPAGLEVGSPVQLVQDPGRTGVIRWMGYLQGIQGAIAGVELVSCVRFPNALYEPQVYAHDNHKTCSMLYMIVHGYVQDGPMDGCGDGEWRGQRYFTCLPGRGFFCPAATLRPDVRIPSSSYPNQAGPLRNRKLHVVLYMYMNLHCPLNLIPALQVPDWEEQDQTIDGDQIVRYLGDMKGIQGHQTSSHIDATIFGLFALSDVFDSLFLDSDVYKSVRVAQQDDGSQMPVQQQISEMLWRGIVNPLRK